MARSLLPDLVLLDMQLPDIDGFAVLRALRGEATTRELRVIALSANAMPDEIAAARRAGADDSWTKPLDFDQFLSRMRGPLTRPASTSASPGNAPGRARLRRIIARRRAGAAHGRAHPAAPPRSCLEG